MEGGTLVQEWLIRPAHRESRKIAGGALHHGTGPRSGAPPASSSEVPGWVLPSHGRFQGSARVDGRPEVIEEIVWNAISRTMDGMLSLSAMDGSRSLAQARRGDVQIGHKQHRAFVAKVLSLHLGLSDPTHMLHYFRATSLASLKSNASTHDVRRPVSRCVLARRSPQNGEINADFSTPSSPFYHRMSTGR
ncbi:hypothetical protein PCL_10283 [Purpureocillium lilacinum]|uniref:Uncharacterized protein n=1 Tax=Purpureocillium lilacinum TaxID=33203 RepID=A0A2U3EFJ3_PURLI|nr:hypothetical protein PCL_10283 [Purpureocillium lilacinum]